MPRDYDDDDRPRRRRVHDEDRDDRPRSRRPARDRDDSEDDDRPRRKARRHYDDDYDERPRRRRRPKQKQQSVMGMVALVIGIVSVFLAFVPCLGVLAILPGLAGLVVGFIALLVAHKSDGRQSSAMPIAGLSVCALAVIIAALWLIAFKNWNKEFKEEMAQARAEAAKEREERNVSRAKMAQEVQAATAPIRVSAVDLAAAYDRDEDQAETYYMNKILEVTGTIERVNFDEEDDTYVVLLRGGRRRSGASVVCEFVKSPAMRAQLAQLRVGAQVTIRGKYTGDTTLDACMLVQ